MALWFVVGFWLVQICKSDIFQAPSGEIIESAKYHKSSANNAATLEIDHADYIIVRVQLDWYGSHGADISSHGRITPPSENNEGPECQKHPSNCTNITETGIYKNWEFNMTDSWDQYVQMEWIAFNATALDQQFWETSPGNRSYDIGTALQPNISITLDYSYQNHNSGCINFWLTRNGEIYSGPFSGQDKTENITVTGSGDVGDEWGLCVVINTGHNPMIFNATVVQTYGFSGKVNIIPSNKFKIPLSLGEEFTIDLDVQNEYVAHAGAQIFYKPCESRSPSKGNKNNPCGKQDQCFQNEHGVCAAQCSNQKNKPNDKTGKCGKGMWWWWILLIAGVVLLAIIITVVVCIILRKKKQTLYVPPESMPICPVIVMCDGDTKESPENPLLRKRQMELQRDQEVAAEQREREKIHLNIRGNSPSPAVSTGFTGGANGYNQIPGNNAGNRGPGSGYQTGGANRFNPGPGGINSDGRFGSGPGFRGKK